MMRTSAMDRWLIAGSLLVAALWPSSAAAQNLSMGEVQ